MWLTIYASGIAGSLVFLGASEVHSARKAKEPVLLRMWVVLLLAALLWPIWVGMIALAFVVSTLFGV